jgi:serine/threonine-protein kinase
LGGRGTACFVREARVTAALRSPHTVEIYDFGALEDGSLYFAMELLEGSVLQALVDKQGPLPPPRVIAVLRQIAASLYDAHTAGLVHRDIKPSNVHLGVRGGQPDFATVLDFGLVKILDGDVEEAIGRASDDAAPGERSTLGNRAVATVAGTMLGTPAYMAPELVVGSESVDDRVDIYALGGVGYFMLTGQPPFVRDSVIATMRAQVEESPRPPSAIAPAPIPAPLEALILACLEKRPEDRPQGATEVLEALDAMSGTHPD